MDLRQVDRWFTKDGFVIGLSLIELGFIWRIMVTHDVRQTFKLVVIRAKSCPEVRVERDDGLLGSDEKVEQSGDIVRAVVDGRGSKQNHLFAAADVFEVLVILGVLVAKTMDFVDDYHLNVIGFLHEFCSFFEIATGAYFPICETKLLHVHRPAGGFVLVTHQPGWAEDHSPFFESFGNGAGDNGFAQTNHIGNDHAVILLDDVQGLLDRVQLVLVGSVAVGFESFNDRITKRSIGIVDIDVSF